MYNKYLDIFIKVADCGSFTKAADELFMSPTAVMKQMNLMESDLDLSLFKRTNHGIVLTDAGKQIYKDAKYIINYSNEAIQKARDLETKENYTITIGTSLICPCKPLLDLWYKINDKYPEFKIKIVPFEENHTRILATLNSNGTNLDFLVSVCDSKQWLQSFDFLQLGYYNFCVAVPLNHPLAKKDKIDLSELSNEKIMAITGGDSKQNKDILNRLITECENIEIKDAPFFYNIDVFNTCEENGYLLITLDCWKNVHPAFKTIPLSSGEKIPYGVLYSKTPSTGASKFLNLIKNVALKTK